MGEKEVKLFYSIMVALGLSSAPPPVAVSQPMPTCMQVCEMSEEGYALVRTFEGYMPFPYKDIAGIETVGYGYVIRPGDKLVYPLLPPDADALLKKTMKTFENDINNAVIIQLHQNQFDAIGSFTYNVGSGALRGSTLLRRVNESRHSEVPNCFLMWNKARVNGVLQPVRGLTLRREAEAKLYGSP